MPPPLPASLRSGADGARIVALFPGRMGLVWRLGFPGDQELSPLFPVAVFPGRRGLLAKPRGARRLGGIGFPPWSTLYNITINSEITIGLLRSLGGKVRLTFSRGPADGILNLRIALVAGLRSRGLPPVLAAYTGIVDMQTPLSF